MNEQSRSPEAAQPRIESLSLSGRSAAQLYISALQESSLAVAHRTELSETLRAILLHAGAALRLDHGFVYVLEGNGTTMKMVATTGMFQKLEGIHCEPKQGLAGKIWATEEPVLVNDYEAWTGKGIDIQADGARALLGLPIKLRETVVGVLVLATQEEARTISPDLLQLLSGFVELMAIILHGSATVTDARVSNEGRERAEREWVAEHRDEQSVLDELPALIWVKDRENKILRANRYAADFLGLPVESVQGQYLWELDTDHAAADYREDLEVLDSGYPKRGQVSRFVDADGTERWLRVDKIPYAGPEGDMEGLVVFGVDVTNQHIDTARLEASRTAAEQANRIKSKYLSAMSREVRGSMNGILLRSDRLMDSTLDTKQREMAAEIRAETESLLDVINDVLDFSRIEAGNLAVEVGDFEVRTLVEDVLDVLAKKARDNGLELASYVQPSVPKIVAGDPSRLRQVLVNLVATAIQFAPEGEVLVQVRIVATNDTGWELRYEVRDTGSGITEKEISELLEPYTLPEQTIGDAARSGLGLAVSQRLVELMSGTLGVETNTDGGVFWCTVPCSHPIGTSVQSGGDAKPEPGARILVAEPNTTLRQILRRQLTELGMHVDVAGDTSAMESAIRAAAQDDWPYKVAFLGRDLPGESSLSVSRKLKDDDALPPMLLLLLTPLGQPISPAVLERAGIDGVLHKPLHHHRVWEYLTSYLGSTVSATTPDEDLFRQLTEGQVTADLPTQARILIVDDNATDHRVMRLALSRLGYAADVAGDVEEAMHLIQDEPYDLILMDTVMPERSGYEAASHIRRLEGAERHTAIIGVSIDASARVQEECLAAGMNGCITKPVRPRELQEILTAWISVGS